jgi:hypothetical protein
MHVHAQWLQFLLFTTNKYGGQSTPCNVAIIARRMVGTCGLVRWDQLDRSLDKKPVNERGNGIGDK